MIYRVILVLLLIPALSFAGNRYQTNKTYYYVKPVNGPARISTVWEVKGNKIIAENSGQRHVYKAGKIKLIKVVSGTEANSIHNSYRARGRSIDTTKVKYKAELDQCFNTRHTCLVNKPKLPMHYNGGDINGDPFKCGVVYEAVGSGATQKMRPLSKEEGRRRVAMGGKAKPRYSQADIQARDDYVASCHIEYKACKKRYGLGEYDY